MLDHLKSSASMAAEPVPATVYLLADHLDAALAAGEDLAATALAVAVPAGSVEAERARTELAERRRFVHRIETLEMSLVGRVLEARKKAADLRRADVRFKPVVSLFNAGTTPLVDALEELGQRSDRRLGATGDVIDFLRDRAMIAPDAGSLAGIETLAVTDQFRVAGRIELGPLLDLVATFLDALEMQFELFATVEFGAQADEHDDGDHATVDQPAAEPDGARATDQPT